MGLLPAGLYALQNTMAQIGYQNLDSLTFNLLNQTKVTRIDRGTQNTGDGFESIDGVSRTLQHINRDRRWPPPCACTW